MLSVVFLDMWATWLIGWPQTSSKGHSWRYILALINHIALQSLILHRLIQYLLHVHWAAHLLFLVDWIGLCFVSLSTILRHFVQNVLDTTQFRTCQVLFFVVAQVQMSLIELVVINRSTSRTASLWLYRNTTILLLISPFKHTTCVLYDWLGNLGPAPHHRGRSANAIGCAFDARRQTLMDQLMSLRDALASRRLVILLSWNIARISLEELSILTIRYHVLLRSSVLMWSTCPTMVYDRLLAEANDILEIICLSSISSLSHIAVDH